MNRSLFSLVSGFALLISAGSPAAVQTYKTCTTVPLTPSGFSHVKVGPFKILVQFDDTGYFVNLTGLYGVQQPKPIHLVFPATRTNAVDTNGRDIFTLQGSAQTVDRTFVLTLTLSDQGGPAFLRIDNMSKSMWGGRAICR